jgi:membrane protein DedA with SNARE-associated domain
LAELVSNYGVWVVAAFIALESIGIPLPAETALIAAAFSLPEHTGSIFGLWSLPESLQQFWARLSAFGSAGGSGISY